MWNRSPSRSTSNVSIPESPDRAFSTRLGQSRQPSFSNFAMSLTCSVTRSTSALADWLTAGGGTVLVPQPTSKTAIQPSVRLMLVLLDMDVCLPNSCHYLFARTKCHVQKPVTNSAEHQVRILTGRVPRC